MKNERNGRHRRRALPKFAPSLLRIATFFGRPVMSDGVRKLVTFAHSREVPVFQSSYRDAPFFRASHVTTGHESIEEPL